MSNESDLPVVIALGNRYRGDDGVAHTVVETLVQRQAPCRVIANQDDSMALLNAWGSTRMAIIVDAAELRSQPGTIHRLDLNAQPMPHDLARCSSHGLGLAEALELGKVLDQLPQTLVIYAIEALQFNAGTSLTPQVLTAALEVADLIQQELDTSCSTATDKTGKAHA